MHIQSLSYVAATASSCSDCARARVCLRDERECMCSVAVQCANPQGGSQLLLLLLLLLSFLTAEYCCYY
jgi:hypothetical protein